MPTPPSIRVPRLRGLRLSAKLVLLGVPLALCVPWVSSLLLTEMERLSVQQQSNQQVSTAKTIAIAFNGRDDLFADLPANIGDAADLDEYTLVARPIEGPVPPRLDGSASDWSEQALQPAWFGRPGEDGSFALSLGTRGETLYAYLEVVDDVHVFRDPAVLRLNNADQVRIGFIEPNGEDGRIALTFSESGGITAFRMDQNWRFANPGRPESSVRGYLRATETGYAVECAMPSTLLGSWQFFGLSFVDVDDPRSREIRATTHTGESNLAAYRSPDLLRAVEALGYSDLHVRVIDAQGRVRVDTGNFRTEDAVAEASWQATALGLLTAVRNGLGGGWFAATPPELPSARHIEDEVVATALAGEPIALRRRVDQVETIIAGHPIRAGRGNVVGMIAVEQNIDDILLFQRQAIDSVVLVSVASFFVVPLCLVAFAGRLTWRIGNLRREAAAAIDDSGRLRHTALTSGADAGDEIGDLAHSISNMLARLDEHNTFLKKMPRTLRHEINNPLNALNTSLEHLAQEDANVRDSKYLESAKRGVLRIGAIVQNLADAANLEESLHAEDREVIDVQALVASYVRNCGAAHPNVRFVFRGVDGPVYAEVADYRIEQLLDKLIDNALDFHRANSPIKIQIDMHRESLRLVVANRGPTLPADAGTLFESMVSRRAPANDVHFGLGLHVVRAIAEHHGGTASAVNLVDGSGVAIIVRLPLAQRPTLATKPAPAKQPEGLRSDAPPAAVPAGSAPAAQPA